MAILAISSGQRPVPDGTCLQRHFSGFQRTVYNGVNDTHILSFSDYANLCAALPHHFAAIRQEDSVSVRSAETGPFIFIIANRSLPIYQKTDFAATIVILCGKKAESETFYPRSFAINLFYTTKILILIYICFLRNIINMFQMRNPECSAAGYMPTEVSCAISHLF